ncbi:MAG TPA: FAD-dependent oxidoreductase [Gemmatimonadaceae bacterium]|nr:FAD-dependent oxidoreductase [Gemmatimonadaceae bacterium]
MTGSTHPDVVVVGAGVVGAACALALSREGLRVLVIDAGFPGGGSSSAAMGHIVVMDDTESQLALTAYSRRLWAEMASELPADCEDERRGTLWLATADEELRGAEEKRALYARHGVKATVVDEKTLAEMEPHLRLGLAGALHVPDDSVLYPPNAARYFVRSARARGAEVRERCAAEEIGAGTVRVRNASGTVETISTGAVVNAAGVDAPRLTPGLPIVPRKGHLVITDRYPGLCNSQLVELGYLHSAHTMSGASVAFNVQPRATGQMLIGSSRELVGRDASVNRELLGAMLRRAIEFVPALARCNVVRAWTGFRPATSDKLPLIGRWEPVDNVWIAAGHEGLGITMALGTAELIAAMMTGREPAVDASPFAPGRLMPALCAGEET